VAANLEALLGLAVEIAPPLPEPDYALIPSRRQYDASQILKAQRPDADSGKLRLALTTVDLCLPMLSHVYGQARVNGRVTVISLHRLGQPDSGSGGAARLYDRLAKITLHEVAHALGVAHCHQESCVMNFSLDLTHLDDLDLSFCPDCWAEVQRGIDRLGQG